MRLSPKDWEACSRAVRSVYDCAAAGLLSQGLLPVLAHLVPADSVARNEFSFNQDHFAVPARPDRPVDRNFWDPLPAAATSQPLPGIWYGGAAVTMNISEVATGRGLAEPAVYQGFYLLTRVRRQVLFFAGEGAATRTGVTFNRRSRDFAGRDRDVLAFLAPHVAAAQEQARLAAAAARSLAAIGEGFQAMRRAVLAVEPDGRIRWQSGLAQEWLAEFHAGQTQPATHLPPALKKALDHAARTVLPRGFSASEFCVSSPSGYRFVVQWGRAQDGSFTLALVRERTKLNAALAEQFELTGREAEILHWISEAKTNLEITSLLGIARRTTEKHIEHLFAKLGVQSRVEAQRLAWELRRG